MNTTKISPQKTDKPVAPPAPSIETITEYARQLNQREQDARQRLATAKADLRNIQEERDKLRENAEVIANVLTPKRQRRNRDDDPAHDAEGQSVAVGQA
jgi:hypothetical protein